MLMEAYQPTTHRTRSDKEGQPRSYCVTRCHLSYKLADRDSNLQEALDNSELRGYCQLTLIDPTTKQLRPTCLEVRYGCYTLDAEWQYERDSPVALYGLLAQEAQPTDSPIAWYLLSDYPVDSLEAAQTLIRYYSYRWCLECVTGRNKDLTF